ncbi:Chemotaxis protein methyltransferase CheR [hydrothermal vent metagenome]|uniref:protein-glutamate O-methyltransferase n=1 Tax=hydrothermal vent metagenome TaxID=652676 RepID=A0A3B1AQH5_9ZZZZ
MALKKSEQVAQQTDDNHLVDSCIEDSATQNSWHLQSLPEMDSALFNRWVELVELRTGMRIPENRKSFLLSKLSIRMREIKIDGYQAYFELVSDERGGLIEWETLVDRLTVHETRFWRDDSIFQLIQKEYIEKNKLLNKKQLNLQVWSVGCATGEEPYSLALWFEHFCRLNSIENKQGVHATDISLAALATAREGLYPENRLTNLPDGYLNYYFSKIEKDKYRVNDNLKERVCFTKLNLLKMDSFPFSEFDVIVCQNVMIYFDQALRIKILNKFANYLKVGGILILGAGEVLGWNHPKMESLTFQSTLAFRRSCE